MIEGELAPSGVSLVWWSGGTPSDLVGAATTGGCDAASLWVTMGGTFHGYAPASPAFANQGFLSLVSGGVIEPRPVLAVCTVREEAPPSGARSIGGTSCTLFPDDNPWAQRVDTLPRHPNSAGYMDYLTGLSGNQFLHADFGENPDYGIPWVVVPSDQPGVPVTFEYDDESDPGPYPIPPDAPIEAGFDAHVIVVQDEECMLYEMFAAERQGSGWSAGSGAVFDLNSNALRPRSKRLSATGGLVRDSVPHKLRIQTMSVYRQLARIDTGETERASRLALRSMARSVPPPAFWGVDRVLDEVETLVMTDDVEGFLDIVELIHRSIGQSD